MRKIDTLISNAIVNAESLTQQNTAVLVNYPHVDVYLHGNHIFSYNYETKNMAWDDCGWATKTTSSRLNACFNALEKLIGKKYHYSYHHGYGSVS